jgi:hypothetical protein
MRFSGGGFPYYPATLSINTTASTNLRTGYVDADSVIRPADAAYPIPTNNAVGSSTPYYATNSNYKPVMLNRPFRAAGELGYSFRDLPWKSLDLFTDKSGDPGILDVFTVTEEPAVVGGRVNLNTRQAPVVQAILAGTIWNELDSTDTIARTGTTATASETIAQRLVSETSSTPLVNRASLVSQSGLPLNVLPLPTGSTFNQTVKSRREAVVRALSTVGQTRTWNLMVDVIAQAGRYPPTATTLDQFVVEGEKRYWLHIAVDRFTGEVIDQQLEPVYE